MIAAMLAAVLLLVADPVPEACSADDYTQRAVDRMADFAQDNGGRLLRLHGKLLERFVHAVNAGDLSDDPTPLHRPIQSACAYVMLVPSSEDAFVVFVWDDGQNAQATAVGELLFLGWSIKEVTDHPDEVNDFFDVLNDAPSNTESAQ